MQYELHDTHWLNDENIEKCLLHFRFKILKKKTSVPPSILKILTANNGFLSEGFILFDSVFTLNLKKEKKKRKHKLMRLHHKSKTVHYKNNGDF